MYFPYFYIVVILVPISKLLFNLGVVAIAATGMFRPVLNNKWHINVTESNCATVVDVTVAKTVYSTVLLIQLSQKLSTQQLFMQLSQKLSIQQLLMQLSRKLSIRQSILTFYKTPLFKSLRSLYTETKISLLGLFHHFKRNYRINTGNWKIW